VNRVFIDTSAFIALLDRDVPQHAAARATLVELADRDLVTTGYVVAESIAVVRRRFGVDGAMALVDDILPLVEVLPVDQSAHASALARYRASLPSRTSFVDQVSFHVITRDRIEVAFALDADFAAAGLEVVPTAIDI
jgi:predicted nucleic acid-binding protein